MAAVGGAVRVIGQQVGGGGGGGVSADDELQVVWRLGDQRNDEAAVKVPRPYVVYLKTENVIKVINLEGNKSSVFGDI